MNKPTAYGIYKSDGVNVYRTAAHLQWGNSDKSLGACLLLNPGSATLAKSVFQTLKTNGVASGQIETSDPTMKQIIALVEKIYQSERALSGRLHIYNLFNLQNSSSKMAINQYEDLVHSGQYKVNESLASISELQRHPWLLLGWGANHEQKLTNLLKAKNKWLKIINESGIPTFGKPHPNNIDYYHPCPLIPTHRPKMLEELVELYKEQFFAKHKRFTFLKWNGEYGDEAKFIVRDNDLNMQSLFTPGRCKDLFWFYSDLSSDEAVSCWEGFGVESVDDLEEVAF